MKQLKCQRCKKRLGNLEIALNLKTRGRSVGTFFCLTCLAEDLEVSCERLTELAEYYRTNGCELFSHRYVDDPIDPITEGGKPL